MLGKSDYMSYRKNLTNLAYGLFNSGYTGKQVSSFKLCLTFAVLCEDNDLFLGKPFSSLVLENKADALLLSARLYDFFAALPYGLRDFAQHISVPSAAVPYLVYIVEDEDRPTAEDLGAIFLSDGEQREGTAYTENSDIDFILDRLLDETDAHKAAKATYLDAACGCGAFLVRAVQTLAKRCKEQPAAESSWIDQDRICGIELDPQAALIARAAVWIESRKAQHEIAKNSNKLALMHAELPENIVCADAIKTDWLAFDPDYIIGNPPFMTPNEEQRPIMQSLCGTYRVDYAAAWIVKAADCIRTKPTTRCAYLITNSVTQGAQVAPIWQPYAENIDIDFAVKPFEFGQNVQVWCDIIGFGAKNSRPKQLYTSRAAEPQLCEHINYQLHADEDMFLTQRKEQISGYPVMLQGTDSAAQVLQHPTERTVEYVTAEQMLNNRHSYIITDEEQPPTNYIVIPRHTSEKRAYIPIGWYENTRIACNSSVCYIADADLFLFGLLSSKVHMAFVKYFCGRLEMRYRYSLGLLYNNFVIPQTTETQRAKIAAVAANILAERPQPKQLRRTTLGDAYYEMPTKLAAAHRHLDVLVDKLYNNGRLFASDNERVKAVYKLLCDRA